ncbi:hypothetical protein O3P69_010267 [Scylla paramamosain]|uniref:Uncharacterized protein n=1 Tax=Scylla paramamosain TaxID=85552 RepID=A0AAW0TRQ7_SCYPA
MTSERDLPSYPTQEERHHPCSTNPAFHSCLHPCLPPVIAGAWSDMLRATLHTPRGEKGRHHHILNYLLLLTRR